VADAYVKAIGTSVSLFEAKSDDAKSVLEPLKLGDSLPALLQEFENEFGAIKPYF
jgi:hypothetical protein